MIVGGFRQNYAKTFDLLDFTAVYGVSSGRENVPRIELLWPDGAPGALGKEDADKPSLSIYKPASNGIASGVVVCPGGGYGMLAMDHEGRQIAQWLNARGVAAFVLKYRLGPRYHHPIELGDAQRALRYVRSHAAELGVAADKIGIWGFSAGGHLASTAGTHFDGGKTDAADPIDRVGSRPDFMILCYPVISFVTPYVHRGSLRNLLGENPDPQAMQNLSNETQVTAQTPPTFLFHTDSDSGVPPENSVLFYLALRKAGVAAEMHVYGRGEHGVGLAVFDPVLSSWPGEVGGLDEGEWMDEVTGRGARLGRWTGRNACPTLIALGIIAVVAGTIGGQERKGVRFEVSFPGSLRASGVDGRVLLIIAKKGDKEPRFQIGEGMDTQQIFGIDAEGLAPGQAAVIDDGAQGYPRETLRDVPDGEYYVQALINVYETFHRADGHVVKLHMDQGEGQHWNISPGNLMSEAKKVRIDRAAGRVIKIELSKIIPPIPAPADTKYIKHFRMESRLLSKFWGRPMYIGGVVLLPEGFDAHPDARYPVMYYQGHFTASFATPVNFRETPPTADLKDYDLTVAEYSYKFYQDWTAGRLPRMLIVSIQHANPYYDDSYAVNSANVGPYGDAIVEEFIPYVEKTYRGIGQPWARVLTGGSTGGWEALAQQVFYPDVYNGSWCDCPDPVDFRAYQTVDLYKDKNIFWRNGDWKSVPFPSTREPDELPISTFRDDARWEATLGSRGRSTEQLDIWQAVFSPVGADGYPKAIFDKSTGAIDPDVAGYWKEHYDLRYIMERDWKTLGPKLVGKLHIKVGTRDSYYLDRAVHLLEDFLESTKAPGRGPYYGGDFDYGAYQPHCYSGDPSVSTQIARLTINQRFMPQMAEWMLKTAPQGADVKSWRY